MESVWLDRGGDPDGFLWLTIGELVSLSRGYSYHQRESWEQALVHARVWGADVSFDDLTKPRQTISTPEQWAAHKAKFKSLDRHQDNTSRNN